MKCGYYQYREFVKPYAAQYSCQYFGTIAGTEKHLCQDCEIDNSGTPHLKNIKKWDCTENSDTCYWYKKGEPCKDCKFIKEED